MLSQMKFRPQLETIVVTCTPFHLSLHRKAESVAIQTAVCGRPGGRGQQPAFYRLYINYLFFCCMFRNCILCCIQHVRCGEYHHVEKVRSVSRNGPKQLRRIFYILMALKRKGMWVLKKKQKKTNKNVSGET